jgi:hypothetical protein
MTRVSPTIVISQAKVLNHVSPTPTFEEAPTVRLRQRADRYGRTGKSREAAARLVSRAGILGARDSVTATQRPLAPMKHSADVS